MRSTRVHRGQHDLVAQESGESADLLDDGGEVRPAVARGVGLGPPVTQDRALLQTLLEEAVGLGQGLPVVGGGGEEDGFLRHEAQEPALVAQAGGGHGPQPLTQHLHLGQEREVAVHVRAPPDLLAQGNRLHGRARRPLIAGREHLLLPRARHAHRAFEDGDARALEAVVHREDGAGDADRAVARGHAQVPGAALRGLDDDLTAREADSRIVAASGDGELGALAHLDERAVAQPQHRTRAAARAHGLAFPDLRARSQAAPRPRPRRAGGRRSRTARPRGCPRGRRRRLRARSRPTPPRPAGWKRPPRTASPDRVVAARRRAVVDAVDARQGRSARRPRAGCRNAFRQDTQSRRWSSTRRPRAADSSPRRRAGRSATTSAQPVIASTDEAAARWTGAIRSHTLSAAASAAPAGGASSRTAAIASSRLDSLRPIWSLIAGLSSTARDRSADVAGCGAG